MCIYAFYISRENNEFLLLGNRDEMFNRESRGVHFVDKKILMGLDLREKGTWLGLTIHGKISFLTNHRNPELLKQNAPSRGQIIKKFLTQEGDITSFVDFLKRTRELFNGYNLVFGDLKTKKFFYYSNIKNELISLKNNIYCVSNAFLDTPWPKCNKLKKYLKKIIEKKIEDENIIFSFLQDNTIPSIHTLSSSNINKKLEHLLSPIFVKIDHKYGTMFSYFIKNKGKDVVVMEKDHLKKKMSKFCFTLE